MGSPILQLNLGANWLLTYEIDLVAQPALVPLGSQPAFYPIPSFTITNAFDRHLLAIGASSTKAKSTWRLAFYMSMLSPVPGIGNLELYNCRVPLGASFQNLPPLVPQYNLKITIPRWHEEMSIQIWRYVGPESDSTEDLIRSYFPPLQ